MRDTCRWDKWQQIEIKGEMGQAEQIEIRERWDKWQ
jgi:hypothetical protein